MGVSRLAQVLPSLLLQQRARGALHRLTRWLLLQRMKVRERCISGRTYDTGASQSGSAATRDGQSMVAAGQAACAGRIGAAVEGVVGN